ncbi:uncharacterized protein LOC21410787, partial [Morus notabilis]|uniref:uncharacterized protein LOC21410787 n=1 Tax=Morus notabilis TaxID=981085 RepID=UPI000CED081D
MAAFSVGTIGVKVSTLDCGRRRSGLLRLNCLRTWTWKKSLEYGGLRVSRRSGKVLNVSTSPSLETLPVVSSEDDGEQSKYSGLTSQLVPNFDEVESLLSTICDTTSIAEFEMKLSGFRLHVRRKLTEEVNTSPPPSAAPTSAYNVIAESSDLNGFVSTPSLAITKSETSSKNIQTLVDRAADAGLVIIRSPRVGFFRRSRTIKGKRAPPPCKEKQEVKEGQVVCYIEQLGGELPIESDVSGEVIKILREDG